MGGKGKTLSGRAKAIKSDWGNRFNANKSKAPTRERIVTACCWMKPKDETMNKYI